MELSQLVDLLDDAQGRQGYWFTRMLELEQVIGTERRRYSSGAITKESWLATFSACHQSWGGAYVQWRAAVDQAKEYALYMDMTMQVTS